MAVRVRRIPARSNSAQATKELQQWRRDKDAELEQLFGIPTPRQLPSHHALYRFYDSDGILLYVGVTMNLPRRLRDHEDASPWWHAITTMTVERLSTRAELLAAEKFAISTEQPIYNRAHNWRRRP